ncbi:MAG: Nif3-like dinuclear metal center hexameric protein [Pirellula sp.]|jgi:dinuclear metal center YbgI/SA1388 family protein|nr:Nif3-like dinuclear metal center hexameric protein [Pirellula sp.]
MTNLQRILNTLDELAPLRTAESWDNVGLLAGDRSRDITRILTCLTVTDATLDEAIESGAELIVTHHPIPFKPVPRITADSTTGKLLLRAIEHRIAIYSPHTAWDNSEHGINAQLARQIGLQNVRPLAPFSADLRAPIDTGTGRYGILPTETSIESLQSTLTKSIPYCQFRHTHSIQRVVQKVGIVCGSGGTLLSLAIKAGCDAMLTGEATYHQCLEAEANNLALLMVGHFASESFAMTELAARLSRLHPDVASKVSKHEHSFF